MQCTCDLLHETSSKKIALILLDPLTSFPVSPWSLSLWPLWTFFPKTVFVLRMIRVFDADNLGALVIPHFLSNYMALFCVISTFWAILSGIESLDHRTFMTNIQQSQVSLEKQRLKISLSLKVIQYGQFCCTVIQMLDVFTLTKFITGESQSSSE